MAISISLDSATRTALMRGGFSLYAFRATTVVGRTGLPVIWWQTESSAIARQMKLN